MVNLFVIAILIILILLFFKAKNIQHKVYSIGLIVLLLFFYTSATKVLVENDIEVNSFDGMVTAGKLYMGWLGSVFRNSKNLVGNAIKMDWTTNSTVK